MDGANHRSELDQTIVGIELTLVSIIQGVALTVLIESAREVVAQRSFALWPYVLAGLLIICVFWSRAVLHILTVIRWPLEFGHNFLYIGCALVESISFAQLATPSRWFAFGAAFIAVGWLLFVYDLRLIRARREDSAGKADRLFSLVWRDQCLNIMVLLPIVFLLNLGCTLAIRFAPTFFLERNGHLWLVAAQILGFAGYLSYVVAFFTKISPLIAAARHEWEIDDSGI